MWVFHEVYSYSIFEIIQIVKLKFKMMKQIFTFLGLIFFTGAL